MSSEGLTKEQYILRVLRKTLGNIVKDTAPRPGVAEVLSENTVQEIRELFALIAERERELAQEAGLAEERPYFSDDPAAPRTLHFLKPPKKPN